MYLYNRLTTLHEVDLSIVFPFIRDVIFIFIYVILVGEIFRQIFLEVLK